MSIVKVLDEYVINDINSRYPISLELWLTLDPADRHAIITKIKTDNEEREKLLLTEIVSAGRELNFLYASFRLKRHAPSHHHQAFRKGLELYNGEGTAEKNEKEILPRISSDGKITSINGWVEPLSLTDITQLRDKTLTVHDLSDRIEASKRPVVEAVQQVDFAKDFLQDLRRAEFEQDFRKTFINYCVEMRGRKQGEGENTLSVLWLKSADVLIKTLLENVYTNMPSYDEDSYIFTTSCGRKVKLFWGGLLKLVGTKPGGWLFTTDAKKRKPLMEAINESKNQDLQRHFRILLDPNYQ